MSMIWNKDDFDGRSAADSPVGFLDRSRQTVRPPFGIDIRALFKSNDHWVGRFARACFPGAVLELDPTLCRLCQQPLGDEAAADGEHASCGFRDACQF